MTNDGSWQGESRRPGNPGTERRSPHSETGAPFLSDEDLALRFAAHHAGDARYVAAWGRWYRWTGAVWGEDTTLAVFDKIRDLVRNAAGDDKANVASAKTVAAVHTLARSDRRLAATVQQWDEDPWLLNTPAGVVDLRTGECRSHRIEDYCTRITGVAPGGDCPAWRDFLADATGDDLELIEYLRRACGYMLTGSTREHVLFFVFGPGAAGKSTFTTILQFILGDYATAAPMDSLMMSYTDRHPTDLAGLRGARLAAAVETEEGRRWAEARIKQLTGGDRIAARYMRQDFFEFQPQFKLLVSGNHRPGLRSVDEAMRRRLRLIPFDQTVPVAERDPELVDKLKAEAGGILAWAIEGARDWYAHGLPAARAVDQAGRQYFEAEDALGQWIAEECLTDQESFDPTSTLYAAWRGWAERSGERPISQTRFGLALAERGFVSVRNMYGRGYEGLRLAPSRPVRGGDEGL